MCSSSRDRRATRLLIALTLVLGAPVGRAQAPTTPAADGRPWLLALSALTDENDYEHALGSFHLGLGEATWLSLTAGASLAPSIVSEVHAGLAAIGIEHDFGPVGVALTYEDWGDDGNLETRDWHGELFLRGDDYRIGLLLEQREIDIWFTGLSGPLGRDIRRIRLDADGIGLTGRYRISRDWQVYGAFMDFDYPPRLRVVPRADRLNLLSNSAVTLAYSFVDRYASVGVERAIGPTLLNLTLGRDRSAIDDEVLESFSASVLWPVALRFDLEFTLGSSRSSGSGSSLFGGLTLLIYGG